MHPRSSGPFLKGVQTDSSLWTPTALETAEHSFHYVFRNFGVPEDIVSDHGPQFISHVWKAFFRLLGVMVSLSSGYHPQTNSQTEQKIQELGRVVAILTDSHQHKRQTQF